MKENLQKELTKYLRVINGRDNFIQKWIEKKQEERRNFKGEWEDIEQIKELKKLIHLKAKKYLEENRFKFGKDRDNVGSLIIWEDCFLREREYRQRRFHNVNFVENRLSKFLPNGFNKAVIETEKKFIKINDLRVDFKETTKLRKRNTFIYLDDTELKEKQVSKIILDGNSIELDDGDYEIYTKEWAYYNINVFKKILRLMNKFDEYLKNLVKFREKLEQEAKEFINNQFDKIIILENLKEEN